MDAPLSIMKVEPDMRANAVHCSITENRSEIAGIIKILVEYSVLLNFLAELGTA